MMTLTKSGLKHVAFTLNWIDQMGFALVIYFENMFDAFSATVFSLSLDCDISD